LRFNEDQCDKISKLATKIFKAKTSYWDGEDYYLDYYDEDLKKNVILKCYVFYKNCFRLIKSRRSVLESTYASLEKDMESLKGRGFLRGRCSEDTG